MTVVPSSYWARLAQLAAVWAYGVAQPTLSMLGANPEFLVVRGSTRVEVALFGALLLVGPPLLVLLLERGASLVSRRAADVVHVAFLGLAFAPLALIVAGSFDPAALAAELAAAAAATVFIAAYLRWRPLRTFLTLSVALPIAGFVVFLLDIPAVVDDAEGASVRVQGNVPVVVVVLDELPTTSLLSAGGGIDSIRYPSFARLAGTATWYPRATTVQQDTIAAVPAILTGRNPEHGELPTVGDHPENLFTLLGSSYRMRVRESVTILCPRRECPRDRGSLLYRLQGLSSDVSIALLHRILPESLESGLPSVTDRWSGFAGERMLVADDAEDALGAIAVRDEEFPAQFAGFLSGFSRAEPARSLHFMHLILPHAPWRYLPSGREYGRTDDFHATDDFWRSWDDSPWLVEQGHQRHLLQVAYTDRLLGRLLDRLQNTGMFDRALVVVTADHGISFRARGRRRVATPSLLADVGRVPLFVKYPGQGSGRIDDRPVRTVDILPTVADVLGVQLPWEVEGHSLLTSYAGNPTVAVERPNGQVVKASVADVDRQQAETLRLQAARFGEGRDSLYAIGVHQMLIGVDLASLAVRRSSTSQVRLFDAESYTSVRRSSALIPSRVAGTVEGAVTDRDLELAVAVNGRIRALTRLHSDNGRFVFQAMVSESALRNGVNTVELLAIERAGEHTVLTLLPRTDG